MDSTGGNCECACFYVHECICTCVHVDIHVSECTSYVSLLSEQCKETEGNSRMGKTRGLFKKIRDIKGTFHAKMGSMKDRKCVGLTEAEDIKKRWQEYTEELCKMIFTTQITTAV